MPRRSRTLDRLGEAVCVAPRCSRKCHLPELVAVAPAGAARVLAPVIAFMLVAGASFGVLSAEGGEEDPVPEAITAPGAEERSFTGGEAPGAELSPEDLRLRELTAAHGTEFAKAIQGGTVLKDMTMEQVLLARGEPDRKEVIPPDAELWHYPSGEVAFSAGKVTYLSLAEKRAKTPTAPRQATTDGGQQPMEPYTVDAQPPKQVGIPPIRAGDTYVYESFDPADPGSGLSTRRTVTSTTGGKIVLSSINLDNPGAKARSLHFDREWNLIASRSPNGSGRDYSPALKYYDFPLFPGKTWRQTTTETDIKTGAVRTHTVSGVVKGWETVSVPAGTFHGIRVELQTELYDPSTGERVPGTDISWYVPEVRRSVKSDTTGRGGSQRVIRLLSFDVH